MIGRIPDGTERTEALEFADEILADHVDGAPLSWIYEGAITRIVWLAASYRYLTDTVLAELPKITEERDQLKTRRDELLATIVKVTNQTPYPAEMEGWVDQRAKMIAEVGTVRAELVQVRNDLIAALPTEDERQVLRWMRDHLQRADELVQGDIRYLAALELLQRFLTMKVNHAA